MYLPESFYHILEVPYFGVPISVLYPSDDGSGEGSLPSTSKMRSWGPKPCYLRSFTPKIPRICYLSLRVQILNHKVFTQNHNYGS